MSTAAPDLRTQIDAALADFPDTKLGVALSGGGDSTALLHLLIGWAAANEVALCAVTVDHGLRPASTTEARSVAKWCGNLGVPHDILTWQNPTTTGNLQDQARRARYGLMADWAREKEVAQIALGHTADDQGETFLMRLARRAGVDGLSGMAPVRQMDGIVWRRPLLAATRKELRGYLQNRDVAWIDDPSNEDEDFDRIKARRVLASLEPLGIDQNTLVQVAAQMRDARTALQAQTHAVARSAVRIDGGDVVLDLGEMNDEPVEIWRRLFSHAFKWVSSADYGARSGSVTLAIDAARNGRQLTLQGCVMLPEVDKVRIAREVDAVVGLRCDADQVWDKRWQVSGHGFKGLQVGALGKEGLAQCLEWRQTGRPRRALLASPAIWQGDTLVAAPLAGLAKGWSAKLRFGPEHFFQTILAH